MCAPRCCSPNQELGMRDNLSQDIILEGMKELPAICRSTAVEQFSALHQTHLISAPQRDFSHSKRKNTLFFPVSLKYWIRNDVSCTLRWGPSVSTCDKKVHSVVRKLLLPISRTYFLLNILPACTISIYFKSVEWGHWYLFTVCIIHLITHFLPQGSQKSLAKVRNLLCFRKRNVAL